MHYHDDHRAFPVGPTQRQTSTVPLPMPTPHPSHYLSYLQPVTSPPSPSLTPTKLLPALRQIRSVKSLARVIDVVIFKNVRSLLFPLDGLGGAMVARWTSTALLKRLSKGCGFEPRPRCFLLLFWSCLVGCFLFIAKGGGWLMDGVGD